MNTASLFDGLHQDAPVTRKGDIKACLMSESTEWYTPKEYVDAARTLWTQGVA